MLFHEEVYSVMKDCFELLGEFLQAAAIIMSFDIDFKAVVDFDSGGGAPEYDFIKFILKMRKAASMQTEAMTAKLGLKQGCATSSFRQRFTFSMFAPAMFGGIFFLNWYMCKKFWGGMRAKCSGIAERRKHIGKVAKIAQTFADANFSLNKT